MSSTSRKPVATVRGRPAGEVAQARVTVGELVSAESHFGQDVELLNRSSPEWDRKARVNGAVRRLRVGMPAATVEVLFGKDILASAELRLATESANEIASDAQVQFKAVAAAAMKSAPASSANAVALVRSAVAAAIEAFEAVRMAAKRLEAEAESAGRALGVESARGGTTRKTVVAGDQRAKRAGV